MTSSPAATLITRSPYDQPQHRPVGRDVDDFGNGGERGRIGGCGETERDARACLLAQVGHSGHRDESPAAEDGNPARELLNFRQHRAGQQDGGPSVDELPDQGLELLLQQRVETGSGLVEDQELRPVNDRLHDAHLAAVAGAQLTDGSCRDQIEAAQEIFPPGGFHSAAQAPVEVDQVARGVARVDRVEFPRFGGQGRFRRLAVLLGDGGGWSWREPVRVDSQAAGIDGPS